MGSKHYVFLRFACIIIASTDMHLHYHLDFCLHPHYYTNMYAKWTIYRFM